METKVYVLIKDYAADFLHTTSVKAVSEDKEKIHQAFLECLAAEKQEQKDDGILYDTEEEETDYYYAYNMGYAAENNCLIAVFESTKI